MKKVRKLPLRMNLQLFAGESGEGGGDLPFNPEHSTMATADQSGSEGNNPEPPTNEPTGEGNEPPQQPQEPQEPQMLDFGGRKVPYSPELEALHQDWKNQQSYATKVNQERQQLMDMISQMTQQNQQQAQPQQSQEQQPYQPSNDDIQAFNEAFQDKLYEEGAVSAESFKMEHPVGQYLLKQQFEKMYKPEIEQHTKPIQEYYENMQRQERQQTEIQNLASKFQDFDQVRGQMAELIKANPMLEQLADQEGGLEQVYYMAKGVSTQAQPTPEQLVNDPNFRQQLLQNQDIMNMFQQEYLKNVQNTQQQAPTMMNSQGGGTATTVPESKPKTFEQAREAMRKYFNS